MASGSSSAGSASWAPGSSAGRLSGRHVNATLPDTSTDINLVRILVV
jgi:hypothetical protein